MSLVKFGGLYMINKEEIMEKVKQLWAKIVAHKKISIAVAVGIVVIIRSQ